MGMLASASIGDTVGLYEPIHGSAHDITGKGIANPLASILSAALLLDISLGLKEESEAVIKAVEQTLKDGYRTRDIADIKTPHEKILGTEVMGNVVCNHIRMAVQNPVNN
jgi:3-isopropylmalate dehydrogenase